MMEAVKAGGDRQAVHEALRVHAREAARVIKVEGGRNSLPARLAADPAFRAVAPRLAALLEPARYVGRAPEQVLEFVRAEVDPLIARHGQLAAAEARIEV
jgi:adenylosuccinate lyase